MNATAAVETAAQVEAMTLEAYADTILPGEKRFPGDHAIAGAASGGGAAASGFLEILRMPESGMEPLMAPLAAGLSEIARGYAAEQGLALDPALPPFAALPFEHRTALVLALTAIDNREREPWVSLAMFATIAFDAAAHLHTVEALAAGHPGLTEMRFKAPDSDGLWRFDAYSYGRPLAQTHPDTTPSGSPA